MRTSGESRHDEAPVLLDSLSHLPLPSTTCLYPFWAFAAIGLGQRRCYKSLTVGSSASSETTARPYSLRRQLQAGLDSTRGRASLEAILRHKGCSPLFHRRRAEQLICLDHFLRHQRKFELSVSSDPYSPEGQMAAGPKAEHVRFRHFEQRS